MTTRLIECVPNISEGRDRAKIDAIASVVETVEGVRLLDVDAGSSTHRTVITFVGSPETIVEAAFRLIKKAGELIDMSRHQGEHPRMGATDVCPFVPVAGVTMEDCMAAAHALGRRVGEELGIPGYFYEEAATRPERRNLAHCRKGEYEGLEKLSAPDWVPDFGPAMFNDRVRSTGATAIGARDFLVAYNINLNTTSTRRANAVAFDLRENGRVKRKGGLLGAVVNDAQGNPMREPGLLKCVKGIGWYIEEYGIAQLSLNLTNISVTTVHEAFDAACDRAMARGMRVTGSEIVGLIPKRVLIDAAHHYLKKQSRSLGISEQEKVKVAVKSLGLDDLAPFDARKRVIEYLLEDAGEDTAPLASMTLIEFSDETASESPAPGGGSISAYVGALGVSLGTMVANLSAHKRGWDDRWTSFSDVAERGMALQSRLLQLVDEDTAAFDAIMSAFGLPKGNEAQKAERAGAIQAATLGAMETPLEVAELALASMEVMEDMAERGNPNSVTDAGVGALCARTAVLGAIMNVRVNAADLKDRNRADAMLRRCVELEKQAEVAEAAVRARVSEVLGA
ncbi:MAG: glutamate formimidoyltransferase [Crocinitomicaceae bacterium]|nr:glutamate formimidoyltransferase [Crocinitomicaceae bacterium]